MKLAILGAGTGASQLPNIPDRQPPTFLVEWGNGGGAAATRGDGMANRGKAPAGATQKILFDCSEGVRFRLAQAGYDYAGIHHVAITHAHTDHNAFLHYLQSVYLKGAWSGEQFKNDEMHLYAPRHIIKNLPELWRFYFQQPGEPFYKSPALKFHIMPDETAIIGNGKLSAVKVHHEAGFSDAVAFRLETPEGIFVYSGDTGECEGIRAISQDADLFVCEASARIGDEQSATNWGHLNPRQAGAIAKNGGVKKLILFHHTGLDSDEAMLADCRASGFANEIVIGQDFQVLEI